MMISLSLLGRSAGLLLLALLTCAAAAPQSSPAGSGEAPESIILRWPPRARGTARLLLEKYGHPDQFDRDTMAWFNKGEWKRTIVRRRPFHRDPAVVRTDIIEQTVGYLVPSDMVADLKRFNQKLEASPTAGELTFSSESEATNRLALNLAAEIVAGSRTAADARAFFLKTSRLAAAGKSSPYLEILRFEADNSRYMTPSGADR